MWDFDCGYVQNESNRIDGYCEEKCSGTVVILVDMEAGELRFCIDGKLLAPISNSKLTQGTYYLSITSDSSSNKGATVEVMNPPNVKPKVLQKYDKLVKELKLDTQ